MKKSKGKKRAEKSSENPPNNKQFPGRPKRTISATANMKIGRWIFGKASALSMEIVNSLSAQLPGDYNLGGRNKLSGALSLALKRQWDESTTQFKFIKNGFKKIEGYEWDNEFPVSNLLMEMPAVSLTKNELSVAFDQLIMGQDLKFPLKSFRCDLIAGVSIFNLKEGTMVALSDNQTVVFRNDKGIVEPFTISYKVPHDCLCVVTIFLEYFRAGKAGWKSLTQRDFTPGCILSALYTSKGVNKPDGRDWIASNVNCSADNLPI